MAIDKGDTLTKTGYAYMLKQRDGIPKNSSEAVRYFKWRLIKITQMQ